MLTRIARRMGYANVMSTLALFFALGGTAVAGATALVTGADIRDGSVTGRDVRDRSLTGRELARASVNGRVVQNRSLTGTDIQNGSVRLADLAPSDLQQMRGPQGEPGPQGPQGPQGDPGIVRSSATAPDVPNYADGTTILSHSVASEGGWLMMARMDVTNTSANDDSINCALRVGGQDIGGGGNNVPAGATIQIVAVGFAPVAPSQPIELLCGGGGSGGTFDLANIRLSLAKLM